MQTDREILADWSDIIIKNKKDKICLLMDVAIPLDRNVITEGVRKEIKIQKSKYRNSVNVEHEMLCHTGNHWGHRNCNKRTKKYLETISGKHSIDSLQKTAVLGTSHIIRKVLQSEI
jgi:hypothetical protein